MVIFHSYVKLPEGILNVHIGHVERSFKKYESIMKYPKDGRIFWKSWDKTP